MSIPIQPVSRSKSGLTRQRAKNDPAKSMSLEEYIIEHAEPGIILVPKDDNDKSPVPGFIHTPLSTYNAFKKLEKDAQSSKSQVSKTPGNLHRAVPAVDQWRWLEVEKREGRYREWNSEAIMTGTRQQKVIRMGDKNKKRNERISQQYPETVKTESSEGSTQERPTEGGNLRWMGKKERD
ncbi:hypothetical protein DL95DRAFT_505801 [Leptodontidium sp. 2 PMI_412]|nr:hypothetical protein DL95DRAFT_505801 [Leptodontidium sp. 2 PMI_412]